MRLPRWSVLLAVMLTAANVWSTDVYFQENFESQKPTGWISSGKNTPLTVSGDWRRMVCRFNSGKNRRVILEITTDKGSIGTLWVDNFTSAPAVAVTNAGFENGLTDWTFQEAKLDGRVASEGRKSIRMTHQTESSPQALIHRRFDVEPDTTYEFAVDMMIGDDFQGDCRFLVYDEEWHCIMSNYGEPFAARLVESRDRNDRKIVAMTAEPGKPAQLTRRITSQRDTNLRLSVDCNVKGFSGSFAAELKDSVSGRTILRLTPDEKQPEWQTLSGIAISRENPLELVLHADGSGTVEVDNVLLTPPCLIPEPQIVQWYPATENFVLPETLTVAISGGNGDNPLPGAIELLTRDLQSLGRKVLRTDAGDAALRISIGDKFAVFQEPDEGYCLDIRSNRIIIQSGTETGAFYGVMSLLGLLGRYDGKEALPGCGMTDYPNLPVRGFFYPNTPEECARLKLNFYMASTGYPEPPGDAEAMNKLVAECRKYHLEPVAYICTVPQGYYVERKNPALAAGKFISGEAVRLTGVQPSPLAHPYVLRTNLTDIVVRDAANSRTYAENQDYTVIPGDLTHPYDRPESARRFAIARTAKSKIPDGATVTVSYDAVAAKYPPYCPVEPEVRRLNRAFFKDFTARYQLNYLHPILCLKEFAETCGNKLANDSRVVRSKQTPLELCIKDMLFNLDAMREVNPDVKVMFFTGDVNDYVRKAAPLLRERADNLLAVVWGYTPEWPNAYGAQAVEFWSRLGIASVTMPWNGKRNIQGQVQLARQAAESGMPCLGVFGSNWPEGPGDLIETASLAWRVPRRGEKKFAAIKKFDADGWKSMRPRWEETRITAPGGATLPARRLMMLAPPKKIMAVPTLIYMPEKNRLMLTFNSEYADGVLVHYAMKMFSDDGGNSWSAPAYLNGAAMPLGANPMTAYLGNGKLLAYPVDSSGVVWRYLSSDYGNTWTKLSRTTHPEEVGSYMRWDPPLVTGNRVYETGYVSYIADGKHIVHPYYRISEDGGKTFGPDINPPEWLGVNEVKLFQKRDGSLLAAGRLQNMDSALDQSDSLVVSLSADGGKWSVPVEVQPAGRMHPSIVELPDNRLIMTYVVRNGYPDSADGFPRFGIEAVESRDGGKSWNSADPYRLAEFTAEKLKGEDRWAASVQSTSSVLMPNGDIITAFGTANRADFNSKRQRQTPRDIGLIRWRP